MTNSPYGFGFPASGDILSVCCGKGDRAVYARATIDNHIYLETNGGPIELAGEEDFLDASYDDNATLAILSLAFELVFAGGVSVLAVCEYRRGAIRVCDELNALAMNASK